MATMLTRKSDRRLMPFCGQRWALLCVVEFVVALLVAPSCAKSMNGPVLARERRCALDCGAVLRCVVDDQTLGGALACVAGDGGFHACALECPPGTECVDTPLQPFSKVCVRYCESDADCGSGMACNCRSMACSFQADHAFWNTCFFKHATGFPSLEKPDHEPGW